MFAVLYNDCFTIPHRVYKYICPVLHKKHKPARNLRSDPPPSDAVSHTRKSARIIRARLRSTHPAHTRISHTVILQSAHFMRTETK